MRFLGPDEPEAAAAADAARVILERLEAVRILAILDESVELGHARAGAARNTETAGRATPSADEGASIIG